MTTLNAQHVERLDLTRPRRTASRLGKQYADLRRRLGQGQAWRDYGMWCLHVGLELSVAEIAASYGLDPRTVARRIDVVHQVLTGRTPPELPAERA